MSDETPRVRAVSMEDTEYAVIGEYLCERTPGNCTCSGDVEFGHEAHCEYEPIALTANVCRVLAGSAPTPPAGTADAPDAGGDAEMRVVVTRVVSGALRERGVEVPGRTARYVADEVIVAFRKVRDRLPDPAPAADPAPARPPHDRKLTAGHLTTTPIRIPPEVEADIEQEWTEAERAMRPSDAIAGSAPDPAPAWAEAVDLIDRDGDRWTELAEGSWWCSSQIADSQPWRTTRARIEQKHGPCREVPRLAPEDPEGAGPAIGGAT